ncbi:hypothetical protein R3P38DRAFT_2785787 [Favolaschia claudopus]|uniref:Uncharacterized protein n=1 Tax=Favolaschia claudopus TaxID=2862362 RepID=A0AAW0ATV5_9AGAR
MLEGGDAMSMKKRNQESGLSGRKSLESRPESKPPEAKILLVLPLELGSTQIQTCILEFRFEVRRLAYPYYSICLQADCSKNNARDEVLNDQMIQNLREAMTPDRLGLKDQSTSEQPRLGSQGLIRLIAVFNNVSCSGNQRYMARKPGVQGPFQLGKVIAPVCRLGGGRGNNAEGPRLPGAHHSLSRGSEIAGCAECSGSAASPAYSQSRRELTAKNNEQPVKNSGRRYGTHNLRPSARTNGDGVADKMFADAIESTGFLQYCLIWGGFLPAPRVSQQNYP